ncbi:MAG: hypothetical protein WD049_09035 [Candidatus Paceibacterota bacterium]
MTTDFPFAETGRVCLFGRPEAARYSYRLAVPYLYLVLSDERPFKPHPTKKHYVEPNPTRWHLLTIDVRTGDILQDFPLGSGKLAECRIEDVDEQGLLIGKSSQELLYYAKTL